MSNMEAFEVFKTVKWSSTNGKPVCPSCESVYKPFFIESKLQLEKIQEDR